MTIQVLHNLVHQFNTHEQSLIRFAIKGTKDVEENKSLLLFEFIISQQKCPSSAITSKVIYEGAPDTRIHKLIVRLRSKILDIIISENFLTKTDRVSERSLLRINARKKLLQKLTLASMNGGVDANHILIEESIRDAKKSEYLLILVELYSLKKQMAIFSNNAKEYDSYTQQLEYYKRCYFIEEKIVHHYNDISKDKGYGNSVSPKKTIKHLKGVISEVNKEKKYLATSYSKYLFNIIQLEYLFCIGKFIEAKKLLNKLHRQMGSIMLARGNTHVTIRVESELSTCELFLGNYEKAIKHSETALLLLSKGKSRQNYFITLEVLFYIIFYTNDFTRAEKILSELLSDRGSFENDFRLAKPHYLQACIHFKKREYKHALEIFNNPTPLTKDKTGYDIAMRILRIQCLLALSRLDEAASQIENLRKHVNRNYKKSYISDRNVLISKILVLMQKRGFSSKSNKTESGLIKILAGLTGKHKWLPLTPELIKFHEWYEEFNRKKTTVQKHEF